MGIMAYAFLANSRETKNRPADEHRFQLKYGKKDGELHPLWQDPFALYTTLLLGIDPERGIFVGYDPSCTALRSFSFPSNSSATMQTPSRDGWTWWERDHRTRSDEPVEVVVGGKSADFLRYVRFERDALGEEQGHRALAADKPILSLVDYSAANVAGETPSAARLHALASEFPALESEVLDLIAERED